MLSVIMLILQFLRRRLYIRVKEFTPRRHLCHFLCDYGIVYRFCRVFPPGKNPVVPAEHSRDCGVIDLLPLKLITTPVFFSYASAISSFVRFLTHGIAP